jgi:hypothetical protein
MPLKTAKTRTLKVDISMTLEVYGDTERALNFQARDAIPLRLNFVAGAIRRNLLDDSEAIRDTVTVHDHYGTPAVVLATVKVTEASPT